MSAVDRPYNPPTDAEGVLITGELGRRASRAPDFEAESRALAALAQEMANSPATVLRKLAEFVLELCQAGSAGVSLLETEGENEVFRWQAIVGELALYQGGMVPREASPCGMVIERGEVLLLSHPERHFPGLQGVEPGIFELLLAPFSLHGKPVGTVWAIGHSPERKFDGEDARVLSSLARIASAAHQMVRALEAETARGDELERRIVQEGLLAAARVATWDWDPEADAITVSESLNDLYGLPPGESIRSSGEGFPLVHPEDRERHQAIVETAAREGGSWHSEFRITRPRDGKLIWLEERALATRDPASGKMAMTGLVWDITERKEAEQALRASEQSRRLALEKLSEADRRKDEFLATLAHELRNPLAPIRNGLEILTLSASGDERLRRAGQMMQRQMSHLVRLVDDLLEVSRISRGKVELRKKRLLLSEVLASVIESTRAQLDAKRIELLGGPAEPIESPIELEGDPDRLAQVFSNLLSNAAKYTEAGGRIWITAQREGDEAVVAVKDTGCGIPGESLESVFEMFSQGQSRHASGGLGIGLALVRQLVQLHGGSVSAQSDGVGRGSTFTVRLPLISRAASAQADAQAGAARSIPVSSPVGRARRILVVDDNADAANSLAMVLELLGHVVQTVYGGPAALQVVESFGPEIVLLDIGMPEMDGYEVARQMRAMPRGKSVRLVALTGWGQEEDKRRALEAGFDEHLTKPVEPALLEVLLSAEPLQASGMDARGSFKQAPVLPPG
jgi:PAS domain S-box-containing protein